MAKKEKKKGKEKEQEEFESCYWMFEKDGKTKYYMIYTDDPKAKKEVRTKPFSVHSDGGIQFKVKEGSAAYNKLMKMLRPVEYELAELQRRG